MPRTAFFAFPAAPSFIEDSIRTAASSVDQKEVILTPWSKLDVQGLKIDDLIRARIEGTDFLIADVTYPNFNVYYEIGFAIGSHKPVIPTLNVSVERAKENANLTGFFDTTGWTEYQNGVELAEKLAQARPEDWANHYIRDKDHTQPLFVLDSYAKTEFRNVIFQTIANSQLKLRLFDPFETGRISLTFAVGEVSSSAGVIIPLLSTEIIDSQKHNLRAALLAGLCHGFGIEAKVIQYEDAPAPLDYRDFIETTRSTREVDQTIGEYCQLTLVRNQQRAAFARRGQRSILEEIDVGASAAENESEKLGAYFVRTAQYSRALRADNSIVVGRKGAGKSAIFFQIIENKKREPDNAVLDLRPASHRLSELREQLLGVQNVVFEHTIAAFWQYIIYAEILLKLREELLPRAKYDLSLLTRVLQLETELRLTEAMASGDFTSRLELAIRSIIDQVKQMRDVANLKHSLTNMLFENEIPKLRDWVVSLSNGNPIVLLIDDLDKGWPARQIEQHDVRTLEHLMAVLNHVQRDLRRRNVEFQHHLFLRSDVYDALVEQTSDRGKYNVIRVDWSDPQQLEHVIRERVASRFEGDKVLTAWNAVNPPIGGGRTAIDVMIENSLMRPRFLIDLCEKAISFAINRGHHTVTAKDVNDALMQHSLYLVTDFGYEIRDVSGLSHEIFYRFLGHGDILTPEEVTAITTDARLGLPSERIVELLLWYGFLGIPGSNNQPVFIYDREYDVRRLEAERDRLGSDLLYVVNGAFLRGLRA